jgi:hypothetical protein
MRSGGKRCCLAVTSALALAWLLVACSNDPSALFARRPADSGTRTVDAGDARTAPAEPADILSLYADLGTGDACLRCLRAKCTEAERTCLEDPQCTANARCSASCRDPNCMLGCPQTLAQRLYLTEGSESPSACRARACVKECTVGRVFDCVGQFEWDRPASPKVTPTVTVLSLPGLDPAPSDVHVRLCSAALAGCDGAAEFTLEPATRKSEGALDVLGQHTLEPIVSLNNRSYFEVKAPGYDVHLAYFAFDRASRAPELYLSIAPPQIYAIGFDNFRANDDPAFGFLELIATDCMADPAPWIHFELTPITSGSHAIAWYSFPPDPDLDRTDPGGNGGFALVDEGLVTVHAKLADTDEDVARISLVSRAGSRSVVFGITPLSASEQR